MSGPRLDLEGLAVFIRADPRADDLVTMRGARIITEANIIVWASPLVHPRVVVDRRPGAEVIDSASIPLEDPVSLHTRVRDEKLLVTRVHTGDPGTYGATAEQRDLYAQIGIPVETIPGISVLSAIAAQVDSELTPPEVVQSMILTRLEGDRIPISEREAISSFAARGTTVSIYLLAARNKQLEAAPPEDGYPPEMPCAIDYRVTWPDEATWRIQPKGLSATMKEHELWKYMIVLASPALATDRAAECSYLYHPGFRHEYRGADKAVVVDPREYDVVTYSPENRDNT